MSFSVTISFYKAWFCFVVSFILLNTHLFQTCRRLFVFQIRWKQSNQVADTPGHASNDYHDSTTATTTTTTTAATTTTTNHEHNTIINNKHNTDNNSPEAAHGDEAPMGVVLQRVATRVALATSLALSLSMYICIHMLYYAILYYIML